MRNAAAVLDAMYKCLLGATSCDSCPYVSKLACQDRLLSDAAAVIEKLQAEAAIYNAEPICKAAKELEWAAMSGRAEQAGFWLGYLKGAIENAKAELEERYADED